MDTLSSILKKILPGALPKTIFGVCVVISVALYKFYPDLPAKWLPTSEVERFLWRLITTGISLLLGAIALIASLIHEINKKSKLADEVTSLTRKIEEQQKTIDTLSKTAYDAMKHNKLPQLTPKYGVYWDENKQAYCPSCKTLLSDYLPFVHASGKTSYMYHCIKCDRMIPLNDGENPIPLNEAIKKL